MREGVQREHDHGPKLALDRLHPEQGVSWDNTELPKRPAKA